MEFKKSIDRIWLEDARGEEIAFVSFPKKTDQIVEITSTVVDQSLRGQGVAGKLMETLVQELRNRGQKAYPVCTYAVKWFAQHPEQEQLLETK